MSTAIVTAVIVVVLVVVAAVAAVGARLLRSRRLRRRFGPEYRRAVERAGGRSAGERELMRRQHRHADLALRPVPVADRQRYVERWREVQARFVEAPGDALDAADALVTEVMSARGYPTGDVEQQCADLSVEHGALLGHYRVVHDLRSRGGHGAADTEQLRQAFVRHRALFAALLGADPVSAAIPAGATAAKVDAAS